MAFGDQYLFVTRDGASMPLSSRSGFVASALQNAEEEKRKRAEAIKLQYANSPYSSFANKIPESSFAAAATTGHQPMIEHKGKQYFLTEDKALAGRLAAREEENARRAGRAPQKYLPSYSYKTAEGESFKGHFLGRGTYEGMGGNSYSPQLQERRAAKGKNPTGPQAGGYDEEYRRKIRDEQFRRAEKSPPTALASPEEKEAYGQVARQRNEIKRAERAKLEEETPEGYMRNKYGYLEKDYTKENYAKNRYGYWEKKSGANAPSYY